MMLLKRFTGLFVAVSILFTGTIQTAQAAMVSSEQVAQATSQNSAEQNRARIAATLARADIQAELLKQGVDPAQVNDRVAAMTDDEVAAVAQHMDTAPAGAGHVIGALVFIFVLLLVTDLLGLTKIFPFTRSR